MNLTEALSTLVVVINNARKRDIERAIELCHRNAQMAPADLEPIWTDLQVMLEHEFRRQYDSVRIHRRDIVRASLAKLAGD